MSNQRTLPVGPVAADLVNVVGQPDAHSNGSYRAGSVWQRGDAAKTHQGSLGVVAYDIDYGEGGLCSKFSTENFGFDQYR